MNQTTDKFVMVNQPEYQTHFWDYLMGKEGHRDYLDAGRKDGDAYVMPTTSGVKFD